MWSARRSREVELQAGDRLGPYRLDEQLGEGGTGIVFGAVREKDGRRVALKVLKKELSRDKVYLQRFLHEARAASAVENRHLVPILDAGAAGGRHYLAVSRVEGSSLDVVIETRGPLALDEVVRIVGGIASGLDALHADGLIHRDVKPSNIILEKGGNALLTDFGLAKGRAYTVLTRPGQVMGTIDYLAPELIKGSPASSASDIYALGCTAFECVAGTPPFAGKPLLQVGLAHLQDEPPDPADRRPEVPQSFVQALLRPLAKDQAARPPTATAYAHTLRAAATVRSA